MDRLLGNNDSMWGMGRVVRRAGPACLVAGALAVVGCGGGDVTDRAVRAMGPTAAGYPNGNIVLIAPANPGGGWDQTARQIQQVWTSAGTVGVSVEVVNRGGAGGTIGLVILALSMAMVALVVEHMLTIRRKALMPTGLAESVGSLLSAGRFTEADQLCRERPSFLGAVLAEGLAEAPLGYQAVEKSMEDASAEQAARLFRKIEYLSVIGTIAPMLGLLGTVWGMIVAFQEFATKINPPVSELAPGIYQALVTTLMGLGVAVPALAAFAIFRNRVDEFVAESVLTAEQAFADFKRASLGHSDSGPRRRGSRRMNPVAIEQPQEAP